MLRPERWVLLSVHVTKEIVQTDPVSTEETCRKDQVPALQPDLLHIADDRNELRRGRQQKHEYAACIGDAHIALGDVRGVRFIAPIVLSLQSDCNLHHRANHEQN